MTVTRTTSQLLAGAALLAALTIVGLQAPGVAEQAPTVSGDRRAVRGDRARGQYIVEHVAMCVECHSGRDGDGNIIPAERYMGGAIPPGPRWAIDWPVMAPRNGGLPGYTDEEARRLLMQGAISRLGRQLRAPMPRFRMTEQDAEDVIAFMRSVQ
jgi:hypothetical protein